MYYDDIDNCMIRLGRYCENNFPLFLVSRTKRNNIEVLVTKKFYSLRTINDLSTFLNRVSPPERKTQLIIKRAKWYHYPLFFIGFLPFSAGNLIHKLAY